MTTWQAYNAWGGHSLYEAPTVTAGWAVSLTGRARRARAIEFLYRGAPSCCGRALGHAALLPDQHGLQRDPECWTGDGCLPGTRRVLDADDAGAVPRPGTPA